MGKLERFQREINRTASEEEVKGRLEKLKRDIRREWFKYKNYHTTLHGSGIKDNWGDMVLVYLIKRGIL